jgi:hypothetical protein
MLPLNHQAVEVARSIQQLPTAAALAFSALRRSIAFLWVLDWLQAATYQSPRSR